ncbi:hypothetical protein [Algoriphagus boritolerans]|uniref:hypothetical protein n=1 Tax=Algoriphagus boritolerans TaxID=308111 RepID=UPI000AC60C0E
MTFISNFFENQSCLELTSIPYFADHSEETFKLVLVSGAQISEKPLRPLLIERFHSNTYPTIAMRNEWF